jgi:hypothetical protein
MSINRSPLPCKLAFIHLPPSHHSLFFQPTRSSSLVPTAAAGSRAPLHGRPDSSMAKLPWSRRLLQPWRPSPSPSSSSMQRPSLFSIALAANLSFPLPPQNSTLRHLPAMEPSVPSLGRPRPSPCPWSAWSSPYGQRPCVRSSLAPRNSKRELFTPMVQCLAVESPSPPCSLNRANGGSAPAPGVLVPSTTHHRFWVILDEQPPCSELLPCLAVGRRWYYLAPSSRSELHCRPAQPNYSQLPRIETRFARCSTSCLASRRPRRRRPFASCSGCRRSCYFVAPIGSLSSPSVACAPPCHAYGARCAPLTSLRSPVRDDAFVSMPRVKQPRLRFDLVSRCVISLLHRIYIYIYIYIYICVCVCVCGCDSSFVRRRDSSWMY